MNDRSLSKNGRGATLHRLIVSCPKNDLQLINQNPKKWVNRQLEFWIKQLSKKDHIHDRMEIINNFYNQDLKIICNLEDGDFESKYLSCLISNLKENLVRLHYILCQALNLIDGFLKAKNQRVEFMDWIRKAKVKKYKPVSLQDLKNKLPDGPILLEAFLHASKYDFKKLLSREELIFHMKNGLQKVENFFMGLFPTPKLTSYSSDLLSTSLKIIFFNVLFSANKKQGDKLLIEAGLLLFWAVGIDKKPVTYNAYHKKLSRNNLALLFPEYDTEKNIDGSERYASIACEEGVQKMLALFKEELGTEWPYESPSLQSDILYKHINKVGFLSIESVRWLFQSIDNLGLFGLRRIYQWYYPYDRKSISDLFCFFYLSSFTGFFSFI